MLQPWSTPPELQWVSKSRACAIVISGEFVHSCSMTIEANLCELTATTLAKALARREISARAVLEAHLARIAAHDARLSAFITVDADGARRQADACDAASAPIGPLHGVPIAVKDLTDTRGLRTTYGSLLFQDHVPDQDELVVARLRRAGAVIIGKTNTPEFGFGAVCTNRLCGPTRNPFDVALTSGGSSGGSAVAVATGMAPLAHGTDFGGSVRTPASFCDVVSIRPTPGRIAAPARALGWDMLATHGLLARSVDDLELGLSACVGPDVRDPLSIGAEPHDRIWRGTAAACGHARLRRRAGCEGSPLAFRFGLRCAVADRRCRGGLSRLRRCHRSIPHAARRPYRRQLWRAAAGSASRTHADRHLEHRGGRTTHGAGLSRRRAAAYGDLSAAFAICLRARISWSCRRRPFFPGTTTRGT